MMCVFLVCHDLQSLNLYVIFSLWPCVQLRQEALESLNGIIEEANKRIQPTGTGTLSGNGRVDRHWGTRFWKSIIDPCIFLILVKKWSI